MTMYVPHYTFKIRTGKQTSKYNLVSCIGNENNKYSCTYFYLILKTGAGKLAQHLRAFMVLPKNTGSVPRTEMEGHNNQPSVTAVPRTLIPSSDLHSHQAHACVHACRQANTQTHKTNL